MKKFIIWIPFILFFCLIIWLTAGCTSPEPVEIVEGLDFPVQNVADLEKFYCFGIQPWDTVGNNEIHGGIDLAAIYDPSSTLIVRVPIIAPAAARVERIVESVSGDGGVTLVVVLKMNDFWFIVCNFEPQTTDAAVLEEQRRSIFVTEGQELSRGQLIGELVVNSVIEHSYPHLHFGFFYKRPSDTIDYIYTNYLSLRFSNGSDLAPLTGPGSPWEPEDLGMETTFYCPYEYSTAAAKANYDSLPRMAADGSVCNCVCAYLSKNGDCGVCK
jgi:hypothetical protein